MKIKSLFVIAGIAALIFFKPTYGFAQTPVPIQDIADDLNEFSDDMSGAASFMATIGLGWSDTYIGQLIDITPHWGIGVTAGATTLKLDKLNILLENFGYQTDDEFMDKQLLPAYTVNTRIGGFRTAPFDIGIKWGWLPYVPIFKNDISYESVVYGLDFRWEVMRDWGIRPSISIGFEVSRATGGLRAKSSSEFSAGSTEIKTSGDATIGPVWEAWVFDAKLQIAKKFWEPRFIAFGGLHVGAALTKTGWQIAGTGSDIEITSGGNTFNLEDLSDNSRSNFAKSLDSASGNDVTFEATNEGITGWIDKFAINFNLHGGIGFNFGNGLRLDLAMMADIIHFEFGANVGFRYQQ
jgi:hypothetical protein